MVWLKVFAIVRIKRGISLYIYVVVGAYPVLSPVTLGAALAVGGVSRAPGAVVNLAARAADVEHVASPQRRRVVENGRYRALGR